MPLLFLLNELQNLGNHARDESERDALLDLACVAVDKHERTRDMFAQLATAIGATTNTEAAQLLRDLTADEAPLAMEMLGLMAELLARAQLTEKGSFAFQIAQSIAERFRLTYNRAVVSHQLGLYERGLGHYAAAEEALKNATALFSETMPAMAAVNNYDRAVNFRTRLLREKDPPRPEGLDDILTADARARELVLPALAGRALDADDLSTARNLLKQLTDGRAAGSPPSTEQIILESRLARRTGDFERAELLLDQAANAEDAAKFQKELQRQRFFLARDLDATDEAAKLLGDLRRTDMTVQMLYQAAVVKFNSGDLEKARELFEECLSRSDDDTTRANCFGMLGLCSDSYEESVRYLYDAIGLYLKLGRGLDHAVTLQHLGMFELMHARARTQAGDPPFAISEFTRADNLFQSAQQIGEKLGTDSFLLDLFRNRALLEQERGRRGAALEHFEAAASRVEIAYLSFSNRKRAEHFFASNSGLFEQALSCAIEAGRNAQALRFSDRSKARRLLRDAAEIAFQSDGKSGVEKELLSAIQPIRARLLQGRPISLSERDTLNRAEERLGTSRVGSALDPEALIRTVFGKEPVPEPPAAVEPIEQLPGAGVMRCTRCFVYNRIVSSFCSACELRLPKSAEVNFNVMLGGASEQDKAAFADHLYNQAVGLFYDGQFEEAETLLKRASEQRKRPDYSFLLGLCRLVSADAAGALASFREVRALQYAGKYPFWPVPVSPSELDRSVAALAAEGAETSQILQDIMKAAR